MGKHYVLRAAASLFLFVTIGAMAQTGGPRERKPVKPPRDATILLGGSDLSKWVHLGSKAPCKWELVDGALQVKPGSGNIVTTDVFGDAQFHVEFMVPLMPEARDQGRGNSGVYLQGQYEIQILDSYENPTYKTGSCGSIYGQKEPDRNVARRPLEWQTYDIKFRAPRFDASGAMTERPRVTVVWNGTLVHRDVEITVGPTTASVGGPPVAVGPLMLQDHGNTLRFRNIWVRPLVTK